MNRLNDGRATEALSMPSDSQAVASPEQNVWAQNPDGVTTALQSEAYMDNPVRQNLGQASKIDLPPLTFTSEPNGDSGISRSSPESGNDETNGAASRSNQQSSDADGQDDSKTKENSALSGAKNFAVPNAAWEIPGALVASGLYFNHRERARTLALPGQDENGNPSIVAWDRKNPARLTIRTSTDDGPVLDYQRSGRDLHHVTFNPDGNIKSVTIAGGTETAFGDLSRGKRTEVRRDVRAANNRIDAARVPKSENAIASAAEGMAKASRAGMASTALEFLKRVPAE